MRTVCLSLAFSVCVSVTVAKASTFTDLCTQTSPPVLEAVGERFFVNGQPKFPVLVAYYDAMRASPEILESDFGFLKSHGVDGIRIFPLWNDSGSPAVMLFNVDGSIRSDERWNQFTTILGKATKCGFIVDVTFNRDHLYALSSAFSVALYEGNINQTTCKGGTGGKGIFEVVCKLKQTARHVFIDIQNERNDGTGQELSDPDVRFIRDGIKELDPSGPGLVPRLVMVSHNSDNIAGPLAIASYANLDVIAYHDWHTTETGIQVWPDATPAEVRQLRAGLRPIYLQENTRAHRDAEVECGKTGPNRFITALKDAKHNGAAAWTFHTSDAFFLNTQSFQALLGACSTETEFLDTFRSIIDHTPGPMLNSDYDGNSTSDIGVYRPSDGHWYVSSLSTSPYWGQHVGDVPVPGDYDGDGKTDVAIFRAETNQWWIYPSLIVTWGQSGDVPVPGDYDGDGKTDLAVFHPATGVWSIRQSSTLTLVTYNFGGGGDIPVVGDYDGDGKADIAVFRPATGVWYIWQSATQTGITYTWGGGGDIPVVGDYDGDRKADIAVFRPSTGVWYIWQSATQTGLTYTWGGGNDIPVPADYDGDGKTDIGVFRTGVWYIWQSATQTGIAPTFGGAGDVPLTKSP